MNIDWTVIATIAAPILALFVGAWIDRKFQERAKLVVFLGHASVFRLQPQKPGEAVMSVHTHAIIIRNVGRRQATNVRVSHIIFPPDVTVYPQVEYQKVQLPEGGTDLLFPILVPGQQITISYLYYPPTLVDQVNRDVRFDEGYAKVLYVLPQVPPPRWAKYVSAVLMLTGFLALLYLMYVFVSNWIS